MKSQFLTCAGNRQKVDETDTEGEKDDSDDGEVDVDSEDDIEDG